MKVLLFSGYGGTTPTPKMTEIMNKYKGIRRRTGEIIKYVEDNCRVYGGAASEEVIKEIEALMKKDPNTIVTFLINRNVYYIWDVDMDSFVSITIQDVDTSRPWTIKEYDGAEFVSYLDDKKLVDEVLNYWE